MTPLKRIAATLLPLLTLVTLVGLSTPSTGQSTETASLGTHHESPNTRIIWLF